MNRWMNDSMTQKTCRHLLAYQCTFQKECKSTDNKYTVCPERANTDKLSDTNNKKIKFVCIKLFV